MGFDEFAWYPRAGSTGDDKYNVPGAINLAGSQDSGAAVKIDRDYIAVGVPSIGDLAEGHYGWNQVIGYVYRRAYLYNAIFGTSLTWPSYLSADVKLDDGEIDTILSEINALRVAEGFASYTFPTGGAVLNERAPGVLLAHARKALSISGAWESRVLTWKQYRRLDDLSWNLISEGLSTAADEMRYQKNLEGADTYSRRRTLVSIGVPSWWPNADGSLTQPGQGAGNYYLDPAPESRIFLSDTDDHLYSSAADGGHLNNYLGDGEGPHTIAAAVLQAAAAVGPGGWLSFIMAIDRELDELAIQGWQYMDPTTLSVKLTTTF